MAFDRSRKLAVDALMEVEKSAYSNIALNRFLSRADSSVDAQFVTRLFYGTIERKKTLDYMISVFAGRRPEKIDLDVLCILRAGAYQLKYMDSVPDYAAIDSSVELCRAYRKKSAKGFVNAILRRISGYDINSANFASEADRVCTVYSVNRDIADVLMRDHPDSYESILSSLFQTPRFTVVINTTKVSVDDYLKALTENGISYGRTEIDNCIEIELKGAVTSLPGYREGHFFVQGVPSRFVTELTGAKAGDRVVDLCAAPGGKSFSTYIRMEGKGTVISCDPNPSRLKVLRNSRERLGLDGIETVVNSGEVYNEKLEGRDIVICDVPCSGIGTISKKPDLRYKDLSDIDGLCRLQLDILRTGAGYLKDGGVLVYSTCTINDRENRDVVRKFLAENCSFSLVKPEKVPANGTVEDSMVTFLPDEGYTDGFFAAAMRKKAAEPRI